MNSYKDQALFLTKTAAVRYNNLRHAGIAQLVEHLIRNERVVGSNPIIGSSEIRGLQFFELLQVCKRCATLKI